MAFSRINNTSNLLTAFSRALPTATTSLGEIRCTRYVAVHQNCMNKYYIASIRRYPDPPVIPLPTNVSEIFANETGRFTPERARDIAAPVLLYGKNDCRSFYSEGSTRLMEKPSSGSKICGDAHVDSYDCFGAVSLNGTMQSNVPKPFCSNGKSTHLNMPGGQWARDGKYIAEDMQKSHYRRIRLPRLKLDKSEHIESCFLLANKINKMEIVICHSGLESYVTTNVLLQKVYQLKCINSMGYSTNASQQSKDTTNTAEKIKAIVNMSKKERFKRICKDYGSTVIVFHAIQSLACLGCVYLAVIRGVDLEPIVKLIVSDPNNKLETALNNTSQFLVAYTIHKLLAPIRILITLTVTPALVKYLRKTGVLKAPVLNTTKKS